MLLKEIQDLILRMFEHFSSNNIFHFLFLFFSFVANLFNTYPTLDLPTEKVVEVGVVIEETREEKTYRNFINSLGLEPHVNYLYSDLCDGLIILQVIKQLFRKESSPFFCSFMI